MANRQIVILRHGKAEQGKGIDDFDRLLTTRGEADVALIGGWLRDNARLPDSILSSPAARAARTAELVAAAWGVEPDIIRYDRRMYLPSLDDLFAVLAETPAEIGCLMAVGHNPGFEMLLESLVGPDLLRDHGGAQMATASAAVIDLTIGWDAIAIGMGQLAAFVRPKELR